MTEEVLRSLGRRYDATYLVTETEYPGWVPAHSYEGVHTDRFER